jgi:3-phenylpropionate/cinnamic acid dioxygenase small subunit
VPNKIDMSEITSLLATYGWAHDERRFDELERCFTEDATYLMEIAGGQIIGPRRGRGEIVRQIKEFKSTQADQRRHVITGFMFLDSTQDWAEVRSYVTVLATADDRTTVVTAGWYLDEVTLTPDGWRISAKTLHLDRGF